MSTDVAGPDGSAFSEGLGPTVPTRANLPPQIGRLLKPGLRFGQAVYSAAQMHEYADAVTSKSAMALATEILRLNVAWNAKEPEQVLSERLDLCRRLAIEIGAKHSAECAEWREVLQRVATDDRGRHAYECEDCIGMKQHGCFCAAMGARQAGGPGA